MATDKQTIEDWLKHCKPEEPIHVDERLTPIELVSDIGMYTKFRPKNSKKWRR